VVIFLYSPGDLCYGRGIKKTSPMHLGFGDVSVSIVGFIESKIVKNMNIQKRKMDKGYNMTITSIIDRRIN